MQITPKFEKKENQILTIFKTLNWEEQYFIIGVFRAIADRNHDMAVKEETTHKPQRAGKIIPLYQ